MVVNERLRIHLKFLLGYGLAAGLLVTGILILFRRWI